MSGDQLLHDVLYTNLVFPSYFTITVYLTTTDIVCSEVIIKHSDMYRYYNRGKLEKWISMRLPIIDNLV